MSFRRCDILAQSEYKRHEKIEELSDIERYYHEILEEESCFSLSDLAINGNDLIELGFCGREIGEVLRFALNHVVEDPKMNKKDVLMSLVYQKRYTFDTN